MSYLECYVDNVFQDQFCDVLTTTFNEVLKWIDSYYEYTALEQTIEAYSAYNDTLNAAQKAHVKQLADQFIVKSDRYLTKYANKIKRKLNLRLGDADDLKNDLVLQVYSLADHFDESRGIPFNAYIIEMLKYYQYSPEIQKAYTNPNNTSQQEFRCIDDWTDENLIDKHEISSLERCANVYSLLEFLEPHERVLVDLVYEKGLQLKQIDELIGVSHSTTWHRMQAIMNKIRTNVKCQHPQQ